MSMTMDLGNIKALALELAKDVKTPEELSALSAQLTKITVEAAIPTPVYSYASCTWCATPGSVCRGKTIAQLQRI